VQTGPDTIEFDGDFTIRGVTKQEKLNFTVTGKRTGSGTIKGTMAFDRKQYGMNSGIPFIKIADRVDVSVDLKGTNGTVKCADCGYFWRMTTRACFGWWKIP